MTDVVVKAKVYSGMRGIEKLEITGSSSGAAALLRAVSQDDLLGHPNEVKIDIPGSNGRLFIRAYCPEEFRGDEIDIDTARSVGVRLMKALGLKVVEDA